jgi:SAM-dependent methyltransferase
MGSASARTTWGLGDYPRMAARLEAAASVVVARAAVDGGDRVLDLACGTGNAAILAAERDARVSGVDFEPVLLDLARERAIARGLDISSHEADAAALPFGDNEFSAVLSVFGVMYTGDQLRAACELSRVCAPDGRVVLASWCRGSTMSMIGGVLGSYLLPPPAGTARPTRWGEEQTLAELLGHADVNIEQTSRERLTLQFADDRDAVEFFRDTAGHVVPERKRLEGEGRWPMLLADLRALLVDRDTGECDGIALELEYLLAACRVA